MRREELTDAAIEANKYVGGGSDYTPIEDALLIAVRRALEKAACICETAAPQSKFDAFAYHACAAAIREFAIMNFFYK